MNIKYLYSTDGTKIAYSLYGDKKEAILLMHGSGCNKEIWQEYGWVDALQKDFSVITMDIRGFGESDKSHDTSFYDIQNILNDILYVTKACGFESFYYFGHSYGATIGMQALANNLPM